MTGRRPGTVRGLILLAGGTGLAAVLGLGFQSLLAFWFGAGSETDAFFMSLSIFAFLGKFLMLGHVRSLALPLYARVRAGDPERARELAGRLLGVSLAGVVVVSLLAMVAAPVLVDLLAPGYAGDQRALTVLLLRIRVPGLVFLAATTVSMAFLESRRRFGVTISAQKVVPAAVSLALLLAVADRFGIVAVGWIGLAAGGAGAAVILAAARRLLGPIRPHGALRDAELRDLGRRWAGLSPSNAATFLGEWAFRVGASLLPVGVFSAVLYGRMLHDLLHAAVNDSAQTVALPRFAAAVAAAPPEAPEDAHRRLEPVLGEALGALASVSLPLTFLVAATAPWTVALLFARGRFLENGMLQPAAVSLAVFAVGFFVQGLVQLLFAGAFSTSRADLVNRVQLVGHAARAVVLVPMVWAFGYVGLVGSQVAMNLLVLVLLAMWAPRGWALLGRGRAFALRLLVASAVPALLYGVLVAPRLPDPLALGSLGRAGVVAVVSVSWLSLYALLALWLDLPGTRALRRRLRWTLAGGAAVLPLFLGPPPAAAQEGPGWAPLPDDHWSLPVLEWMEARGTAAVGNSSVRPVPAARVSAALAAGGATEATLAGSGLAAGAGGRLGAERPRFALGAGVDGPPLRPALRLAAQLGGDASVPFAFLDVEAGHHTRIVRGGVGAHAGPLWIFVGRERLSVGGGRTGALVLNPSAHLDGLVVATAEPVRIPLFGSLSLVGGVGPLRRYETVEDPWWAHLRATLRPAPWLQIGLSRGILAGGRFDGGSVPYDPVVYGPDEGSLSGGDVLRVLAGRTTGYDDQLAALDVRFSLAQLGVPLLGYAELGWEDADRSWGDPALLAGLLLALSAPTPVALRYEYVAFGRGARLCAWCDTLPAYWYRHVRFQSGWRAGDELFGHPLGGYGRQHTLAVSAWSADARLSADLRLSALRRERWNLLESARPGSGSRVDAAVSWKATRRVELSAALYDERGEGWHWWRRELIARTFF